VAISDIDDVELLVSELSASLAPPQRHAFLAAARVALADIPCLGPGIAFRTLAELQKKGFWDPPPDTRSLAGPRHNGSKLVRAEPIGAPDPREDGRARRAMAR
jgi:hypothetical protein